MHSELKFLSDEEMSANAKACFRELFDSESRLAPILDFIESL